MAGISGRIGAGAREGLEEVLERVAREQAVAEAQRQSRFREGVDLERLGLEGERVDLQRGRDERTAAGEERADEERAGQKRTLGNMAGVVDLLGEGLDPETARREIIGTGLRGGTTVPRMVEGLFPAQKDPGTVQLTVPGPGGRPVVQLFSKDDPRFKEGGIETFRGTGTPAAQKFERVETADAEGNPIIQFLTAEEIRGRGGVPKPPTGTGKGGLTPSIRASIVNLKVRLNELRELEPALTQRRGFEGKVAGAAQTAAARVTGEDEQVVVFNNLADSLIPAIARSAGEVGNLSQAEQNRVAGLAPQATDPKNVRDLKFKLLDNLVKALEAGSADTIKETVNTIPDEDASTKDPLGIRRPK